MTRKLLGNLTMAFYAAVLLGVTVYTFWPFIAASNRMRDFCAGLDTGLSVAALKARAEALGYDVTMRADGSGVVDDPQSFGRLQCEVRFGPAGLQSAE